MKLCELNSFHSNTKRKKEARRDVQNVKVQNKHKYVLHVGVSEV